MTPEKIKKIIQNYRETINSIAPVFSSTPYSVDKYVENIYVDSVAQDVINQVLWMCDQIDDMLIHNNVDKSMRWLGFIQGILWITGVKTIDEMREDNREKLLEAKTC